MAGQRIKAEADLYGTVPDAIKAGGGEAKLKSCGTVYTGAFQTQAVAWYMHLHEMDSEIFAFPPGTTIAPSYSALSRDPRFPTIAKTRKWVIGSSCAQADVDATPRARPGAVKARALTGARVAIPAGIGALVALSLLLRTTELGIGFWIDEGLSVGIADRPLCDIPLALREDGSPPLYYMLLHFWLDIAGRSEAGVRGLSLLFALLAIPAGWWAGRPIWGTQRGGVVRGRADGLQPVPGAVRAGGADVLAGGAAGDPRDDLLPPRLRAGHREPAGPGSRASRSRSRSRSTPTTGRSSSPSAPRSRGRCCGAGRRAAPQGAAARRPAGLRRPARALPAVGPDDALPGRAHRRAVGRRARVRLAARRPRRAARPDAADRPADLRRRGPDRAAGQAAAERARPRRAVPGDHRRAHADDRVDCCRRPRPPGPTATWRSRCRRSCCSPPAAWPARAGSASSASCWS